MDTKAYINDSEGLRFRLEFSQGYDRGNYGNAYESQDWERWSDVNGYDEKGEAYREGMILGFFSSYELSEVGEMQDEVEALRLKHGEE